MISLIWAMDQNRLIGRNNKLPWHLPADLAYFKMITAGHTVIMGRKTFESIGRPLPDRKNVIVTRDRNYNAEGCIICSSIEEALKFGKAEEAFIIGGAEIYSAFLPYADRLYVTVIEEAFEGDSHFPEINYSRWELISKTQGEKDHKNPYTYWFLIYTRKN